MSGIDLTPGSAEWARRVSPSKAAGILGLSPWESPYGMWRKMRGDVPWDEESPAMERGNLCEPAVLAWWRKHHEHTDWREQVTLEVGDWCVATPDGIAQCGDELVMIEAKTAANMDDWGAPDTDEIPTYYLTQVYVAMHVCHLNGLPVARAHIPVLGGYRLLFSKYVVEYDAAVGAELLARLREFHATLDSDTPPPLDESAATYEAVRKVHAEIDRGESVELTEDEAASLIYRTHDAKRLEASARKAKAVVIDRMGRAQYATHNGVRIARRQPHGSDVRFVVVAKPEDLTVPQGDAA